MIISVSVSEQDEKRLLELKKATESSSISGVIRDAIRAYHKKILPESLTVVNKNSSQSTP